MAGQRSRPAARRLVRVTGQDGALLRRACRALNRCSSRPAGLYGSGKSDRTVIPLELRDGKRDLM